MIRASPSFHRIKQQSSITPPEEEARPCRVIATAVLYVSTTYS